MYAIDLLNQFQDYNGTVLSNGKMYVYYLGRVALANVYHDIDGQVPIANPVELDNLGMAQVYVSNAHDYTIVLTDVYGNEMFSRDLFVNGSAEGGGGNARLYEGIDPIVVNNQQNIISAKLANLGVESPLYFIEDTEESTVIGVSGDFASVSASGNLTAYKEDDVTWISGKDWSTDITNASANAYEQATANDYRPLFEGNNGKISAIDNSAILIPDVVDYSAGANINISNHVVSLDTAVELTNIINNRGAILDPSGLYVSNLQQTTYTEIGKDHVLSTDGSASIGWQLGNKAISISDDSGNGDYRNLILGLDDVLLEERHQEPTPDKVYSLTGACESALSAINMINSGDNQAYSAGSNINITDHVISGKDWSTEIGDKLDATAFSTVSGDFLTSLPADLVYTGDITGKADTSALTAYLTTADSANFYTTANESGFITGVDLTPYQTIEGMTAYQPVGDYLTTADSAQFYTNDNPSGFITGVDLSNYATTAEVADKLDTSAFSDVSGSFLTAHQDLSDYQTTAGMTAYQPIGDYLTTADSANFYTTANESGFISEVPAGTLNESAFEYDANNKISGYNGSAFAGGAAGVSGTNVVFVPNYEGADYGYYYSARISGDVVVTTGNYFGDDIYPGTTDFSLSSVGASIGNKLDKDKIEASNTIKIINNHAEVTDKAYRQTGFIDISAHNVDARGSTVIVDFVSYDANNDSYLYSAIVTVETTASGSYIPNGWSLVSYENNSATFTKYYSLNERTDSFYLVTYYGEWGEFTNAEGSATVYSALELATLAFKDDITGITYTTGSI